MMTNSHEQIAELTIGDTKITATSVTSTVYKIDFYQLANSFDISHSMTASFLRNYFVPEEDKGFVTPSLAAVFLLQYASAKSGNKSSELVIKLLTEYLTPRQQR